MCVQVIKPDPNHCQLDEFQWKCTEPGYIKRVVRLDLISWNFSRKT